MIAAGETFTDNTANVSITATNQMTVIDGTNSMEVMGVEICDAACSQIPAPSNLSASAVAIDSIDLSWTDNSNEDNFSLQRSLDGSNWSTIASPLANTETYTDIGLATATLYYYRVRAQEGGLNSGYSNVANATTLAVPPSADFTYSADFTEVTFTDATTSRISYSTSPFDRSQLLGLGQPALWLGRHCPTGLWKLVLGDSG